LLYQALDDSHLPGAKFTNKDQSSGDYVVIHSVCSATVALVRMPKTSCWGPCAPQRPHF